MSYETELKSWGSTGSEYPNNYSYEEGEQPVDVWDNFFAYHVIEDIEHLIEVTNDDLVYKEDGELESDLDIGEYALNGDAGSLEFDGNAITSRAYFEVLEDLNVSNDIDVGGSVDGVNISGFKSDFDDLEDDVDSVESDLSYHESDTNNPHNVTYSQVGAIEDTSSVIGTSELDLSIEPTWTGEHTFENNVEFVGSQSIKRDGDRMFRMSGNGGQIFTADGSSGARIEFISGSDADLLGRIYESSRTRWYRDFDLQDNNLRLDTGQDIESDDGTRQITFASSGVEVRDGDGTQRGLFRDDEITMRADGKFDIYDAEGGFRGVRYNTSGSSPGTLELTNADLDLNGNDIEDVNTINGEDVDDLGGGFELETYEDVDDLPDPEDVDEPTIAYLEDQDDYVGVFQE